MTASELNLPAPRQTGALIIAGSHVPKTTAQLKVLADRRGPHLAVLELNVEELISSEENAAAAVARVVQEAERQLRSGKDTLVMTSRKLITGDDELSSLAIGTKVAEALVSVLQGIEVRPRYIIAKVSPRRTGSKLTQNLAITNWQISSSYLTGRNHLLRRSHQRTQHQTRPGRRAGRTGRSPLALRRVDESACLRAVCRVSRECGGREHAV